MDREKFTAWEVAAAILLFRHSDGAYRHYDWIAEAVVATGLSGLTESGGITPWETIARDMRERPEYFSRANLEYPDEEHPQGYHRVNIEAAKRNPNIMEVYEILRIRDEYGELHLPL